MTPEQIDAMPAGKELDALIEELIYQAIPLTDDEMRLLRTAWQMTSPSWVNGPRIFKVPTKEPDRETGSMYRLGWPQDFSTDDRGAAGLVHRMRRDGWLFTLYDTMNDAGEVLRVARFAKPPQTINNRYQITEGEALAETDTLAISRAALKAFLALNERGEKR